RPVLGIERIGALQASEAGGVVDAAQQGHEIEGGGLRIGVRRIRELHDRIAVGRRTDDMVQGQLTVDLLQGADGLEPLHLRPVGTQLGNQRVQRQRRPAQRPVDPLDPLGDQLLGRLSPTFYDAELGGHIGMEFADPPLPSAPAADPASPPRSASPQPVLRAPSPVRLDLVSPPPASLSPAGTPWAQPGVINYSSELVSVLELEPRTRTACFVDGTAPTE